MTYTSVEMPAKHSHTAPTSNTLFPVFLKLEQMRLLIIGGGPVGLEKLLAVLGNAPATRIRLVAETILDDIRALAANHSNIELIQKSYEPDDLLDTDVVIAAVNNHDLSAVIAGEARSRKILVNVADTPDLCDFYLSSVVKKGNLKIAISTNGKSPTVAKRLKETLNEALPAELDQVLNNMHTIRNRLNGSFESKVKKLNRITSVLVANEHAEKTNKWKRIARWSLVIFASMLIGHFVLSYIRFDDMAAAAADLYKQLDPSFHWMLLAGFLAQLVDGALGMGYGVTSATILLSSGVSPAAISGSIHTAEMFASGASGYSHYRFGNVNKKMFKMLVIPGVLGAIIGAVVLVYLGDTNAKYLRPLLACYTMFLGIKMITNAFRNPRKSQKFKHYRALAGTGGFLDSFGGGGWGPLVTSTLISKGRAARFVIGTVSLTEFFVTLASAFTFFTLLGVTHWQVILALLIGGLLAAPIAAKLVGKMPKKTAYILIGVMVIIWSTRILIKIL
jgi:uncharacterized protein